jgi:hypothetical protein
VSDDRARRLWSAVLLSLVLLLGLWAVVGRPAFSSTAVSRPDSQAVAAAVPAAAAHAAHRTLPPGPQPQLSAHTGDKPLLTWAILLAAASGGVAFVRWSSSQGDGAAPTIRGRFTRESRAPPRCSLPA